MRIHSGVIRNTATTDVSGVSVPVIQPKTDVLALGTTKNSHGDVTGLSTNVDKVTLNSQGIDATQMRSLKIADMREKVQSGEYEVPVLAVAVAMQRGNAVGASTEV